MIERPEIFGTAPVSGDWRALNTPRERIPSHGTDRFGQRYAFDLVQTDDTGRAFYEGSQFPHFLWRKKAEDFYCWGKPIRAAFDGVVVGASDGWPDRLACNALWEIFRANVLAKPPAVADLRPLLGNHILIQGEMGVALYAHLQNGTVAVRRGQEVRQQAHIGAVGNSGNSTMPHLHFHVMSSADLFTAAGIYCGFMAFARAAADGWIEVSDDVPGFMEAVRFP